MDEFRFPPQEDPPGIPGLDRETGKDEFPVPSREIFLESLQRFAGSRLTAGGAARDPSSVCLPAGTSCCLRKSKSNKRRVMTTGKGLKLPGVQGKTSEEGSIQRQHEGSGSPLSASSRFFAEATCFFRGEYTEQEISCQGNLFPVICFRLFEPFALPLTFASSATLLEGALFPILQ
jgi:hypothetical protein